MRPVRHLLALAEPDAEIGDDCAVVPLAELAPVKGETIAAFVDRAGWDLQLMPTVCRIRKRYYGRAEWHKRKIHANDNVLFISRPAGGGGGGGQGKAIGAAVAMIALAVLAPYAVGAMGISALGSAGALTGWGTALASAITAGGAMLLSHFLQPKAITPSDKSPDLYTFAFQGNQARPQQVIPVGYGRRKTYPDFGAPTYSEFDNDDMLDFGLYCVGVGKYLIEELYLSDTLIWKSDVGFLPGFTGIELQHVEPGEDVTLFPPNVVTSSEVAGIQLSANIEENGEVDSLVGPYAANAPGTSASEIIVDLVFPSGLYYQKGNDVLGNTVYVNVRLWPIDDVGQLTGADPLVFPETFTASKNSQLRITKRYAVPGGRYEVTVQRVNKEPTNPGAVGEVAWSALRAHIEGPQSFADVTMLALKAKADNGLQTLAGGKVGVVATRILPVFANGIWSDQPTRSIAWAAFDAWTNEIYSAGLPSSGVDVENLLYYDYIWAEAGHTFDHSFTESSSVIEALETILQAGRAVPAVLGDTLSIMRDEDRVLPALVFTDREIIRGSLSIDYTLYNSALADGVVGSYLDETTWRVSEVSSAPDGTVLANPARVELTGVTKRPQAVGLVRFQAGDSTFRRTSVTFQIEAEGKLIRRGMMIAVQSELPQVWGASGSIVSASGDVLTLDQDLDWSGGGYMEIRAADGTYWGPVAVSQGTAANQAVVNSADAATVADQTGKYLGEAVARGAGQEPPSFVFGTASPQAFRCLVKEGTPNGDFLTIVAVNDDLRVYDVIETGVPPIGGPAGFLLDTDPPIITQLAGKMIQEGLAAKLAGGWKPAKNALTYEARISYDTGTSWTNIYSGTHSSFSAVVNPADLVLQVRGISPKGIAGAWSQVPVSGIVLNLDGVDKKIDVNDIIGQLLHLIDLISEIGEGSIYQLRQRVDKLSEQIANAAATQATQDYNARKLVKVTLGQDVRKNYAAIVDEQTARISANESFAEDMTVVQSRLTSAEGDLTGQATAINDLTTTVTTQGDTITVNSSAITGLDSRLTNAEGVNTSQATAINSLDTTVSSHGDQLSSQASSITALQTTQDGHSSTLTEYGTSINGLEVEWGVAGSIDNSRGGFVFQGVKQNNGAVNYNLLIDANMYVHGNVVIDGTLTAQKVGQNQISSATAGASNTGGTAWGSTNWRYGAKLLIWGSYFGWTQGPSGGLYFTITVNGAVYTYGMVPTNYDGTTPYYGKQGFQIVITNVGADTTANIQVDLPGGMIGVEFMALEVAR